MIAALAFLKSPLGKYLLIGLAVVGLLTGIYVKGRSDQHGKDAPQITDQATHKAWRDEAEASARDLKTCQANEAGLQAALDRQNSAVSALKADSDARVAKSAKAASDARAVAESFRQNAASILRARPGVDRCASADQLITDSVR